MLGTLPRQGRIYKCADRHCRLLAKLLTGNGNAAVGCINPDADTGNVLLMLSRMFFIQPVFFITGKS